VGPCFAEQRDDAVDQQVVRLARLLLSEAGERLALGVVIAPARGAALRLSRPGLHEIVAHGGRDLGEPGDEAELPAGPERLHEARRDEPVVWLELVAVDRDALLLEAHRDRGLAIDVVEPRALLERLDQGLRVRRPPEDVTEEEW
jgi:hypothetical protein